MDRILDGHDFKCVLYHHYTVGHRGITVLCDLRDFLKKTMDKRWGVVLMVMGVISFIMIGIGLGGQGVVMIVSGWWFYRVLGNLDKAYAQYLETGVIPDLKGQ